MTEPAGPFSSRNCDMSLEGAKVLLIKLKEALVAENSNYIATMVIVSGNVVTDQPGQLDADDHVTTVS